MSTGGSILDYLARFEVQVKSSDLNRLNRDVLDAEKNVGKLAGSTQSSLSKTEASIATFGRSLSSIGSQLSLGVTAPLALVGAAAVNAGRSFETAFAGVRKTVDATEPELQALRQGFRDLAKEIPTSVNEFARIGESAGALGVKKEEILSFTRTVAALGVTTNLTSEAASTGLARIANIINNEAGPQYDRLGATLTALGNAGASTEDEILSMSLRIAGAGKIAGLTEANVLAFGNALSSVGIEAEAGGSAISRVFLKMSDAVKLGGKDLRIFAAVAGQSATDFKRAFETDAANAAISFIEGLGKLSAEGKSLTPVLKELELNEIRVRDALLRASGAGDLFRESIKLGSQAWAENNALTKEAGERYKTFDSQVQLLKNELNDTAITLFDKLRPALIGVVESTREAVQGLGSLDATTVKAGASFLAVAGSAGPVALLTGKLLTLGPQGAVVAGVVAGAGAMSIAYSTNMGKMGDSVDRFASLFGLKMTGTKSPLDIFLSGLDFAVLEMAHFVERVVSGLDIILTTMKAWAIAGERVLALDFSGADKAIEEGTARVNKILADSQQAMAQTQMERAAILRGGWREHYKLLEVLAFDGGGKSTTAFTNGLQSTLDKLNPVKPLVSSLEKAEPQLNVTSSTLALKTANNFYNNFDKTIGGFNFATPIIGELNAAGPSLFSKSYSLNFQMAKEGRKGFFDGSHQSPHYILHITQKGVEDLDSLLAPAAKKGKSIARKMKDAFLSEFDTGFEGLQKAIGIISPQIGTGDLESLFKPMTESAKKAAQGTKDALGVVTGAVNEYLQSIGVAAKFTEDEFAKISKSRGDFLIGRANIHAQSVKAEKEGELSLLETYRVTTKEVNEFLKSTGATHTLTAQEIIGLEDKLEKQLASSTTAWLLNNAAMEANARHTSVLKALYPQLFPPIHDLIEATNELTAAQKVLVSEAERMAERMSKEAADALEKDREAMAKLSREAEEASRRIPDAWDNIVESILRGSGAVGGNLDKLRIEVKGTIGDILDVFDTMPGEIGESVRGVTSELNKWLNFTNSIFKLLSRVIDGFPNSVGSAIEKVFGTGSSGAGGTSGPAGLFSGLISGAGAAGGLAGGAFGSAMVAAIATTVTTGIKKGPWWGGLTGLLTGGGVLTGVVSGIFGKIFGGGKSDEQKRAEEEAKKRAADEAKIFAEELKQSYVKSLRDTLALANEARELLESLAGRIHVPKEEIRKFFGQLGIVLRLIVEESKRFEKESLKAVKQFASSFGPSMTLLASVPLATEGINRHLGLSIASVQRYFQDFRVIISLLGVEAEETPNKLEKQIKRWAARIGEAVGLLPAVTEGVNAAFDLEKPNVDGLKNYGGWLDLIIEETGKLASKYDRFLIKTIEFFSSRVLPGVSLFRETVGTIKEAIEIPRLNIYTIRGVYADLELITNEGIAFTSRVPISELDRAAVVAGKVTPWLNALKLAGEAFIPFRDYKSVKEELNVLLGDFEASAFIMRAMEDFSDQMEQRSIKIHTHLTNSAKFLTDGIKSFGDALSKLSGVLLGGLSSATFPNPEAAGSIGGEFPGFGAGSRLPFAPAGGYGPVPILPEGFARSAAASASQTQVVHHHHHTHNHNETYNLAFPNVIAETIEDVKEIAKTLRDLPHAMRQNEG